jgi:hypothetical protein
MCSTNLIRSANRMFAECAVHTDFVGFGEFGPCPSYVAIPRFPMVEAGVGKGVLE